MSWSTEELVLDIYQMNVIENLQLELRSSVVRQPGGFCVCRIVYSGAARGVPTVMLGNPGRH
jgi:hypothetical protein